MTLLDHSMEPSIDPNADYLAELVGDGKKFKTTQDLARGKLEADNFIETLKAEREQERAEYLRLREDYNARAKLEELINQLETRPKQQLSNEQPPVNDVRKDQPQFGVKEAESLFSSKFQEYEINKRQTENLNRFKSKLKERFGSNQAALNEHIQSLDLSEDDVIALAKKSPTAAIKTLGLEQQEQEQRFQTPPRSSQRSDSFKPKGKVQRTLSYYQELKKTNPKLYSDPQINRQMDLDSQELGEAFFDVPE